MGFFHFFISAIRILQSKIVRRLFFYTIFTITFIGVLCMAPKSDADTIDALRSALPDKIMGWSTEAEDQIYTPQTS